ncbi:unnamed protein product [Phytomonas sp. Hart1]|nr:unnamed protein product [Phytomonas sp. Hart1]|eukprot:CCW66541.1 unnamed protein product [Phytomonas sp. isolate Hart1]
MAITLRKEKSPNFDSSFAAPGDLYRILASSESLRSHLTDSYWCEAMDEVCDGKLNGVVVRYTGANLVMMQFMPTKLSLAGYRYPLSMSIPIEFMVPVNPQAIKITPSKMISSYSASMGDSFRSSSSIDSKGQGSSTFQLPKLCVVCGRYNVPKMQLRAHGWKCKGCKGIKSLPKLRKEAIKLRDELKVV